MTRNRLAECVDLMGQPRDVTRAGLAMKDPLGNRGVDLAHRFEQSLLRRTGIASRDSGMHALHASPYARTHVAIAGSSLDRLPNSFFC